MSWAQAATDFPPKVRAVLATAPEYLRAELVDGFFEREVDLLTPGRNSQTDLMVVTGISERLAIIAVEGKAEESFDLLVEDWNQTKGKRVRLEHLCKTLLLDSSRVGSLRYQLLHRAWSAVNEAKRYRCSDALLLVHSFSPTHRWFDDFAAFTAAMGQPLSKPDTCSLPRVYEGISLRFAWVSDTASIIQNPFILTDLSYKTGAHYE